MSNATRAYSPYADAEAITALDELLSSTDSPVRYQDTMVKLGQYLGQKLSEEIVDTAKCLVASTAEDADYLSKGVLNEIGKRHDTFAAVFWNNHYSVDGGSVAPIVHKFLQPGFEQSDSLIIVKSVISGSCVVRTNILALIERLSIKTIYIVSPVIHENSEISLRSEFPEEISSLFKFVYFAQDSLKDKSTGEVKPGIGGQIYPLLGMTDQPARTNFMPLLVTRLIGA